MQGIEQSRGSGGRAEWRVEGGRRLSCSAALSPAASVLGPHYYWLDCWMDEWNGMAPPVGSAIVALSQDSQGPAKTCSQTLSVPGFV